MKRVIYRWFCEPLRKPIGRFETKIEPIPQRHIFKVATLKKVWTGEWFAEPNAVPPGYL